MWHFDDILRRNPPGRGQRASILTRLLQVRAATEQLLCDSSREMESRTQACVCGFAQLPFPLMLESSEYVLRGTTKSVFVHLDFQLFTLEIDGSSESRLEYLPRGEHFVADQASIGTQVRAFIPLWGRREVYYAGYIDCLTDEGLEERVISTAAWDPVHAPPAYRGKVVTAHAFESELASRIALEVRYVLRKFLINYSVVSLEDLPELKRFYGCFLLAAPGRIAYGNPPEPVLSGMMNRHLVDRPVEKARIDQGLQFPLREIDQYMHQLLAMHKLAKQGEPELAVVGCVTAIEWFMNAFLQPRPAKSLSMRECLKMTPLSVLPDPLRDRLRRVAEYRNSIVHGGPPTRRASKSPGQATDSISKVKEIVETGLCLYREANLRRFKRIS
jgi:hypothetical protein